ncbi:MAG: TfoX/Sxy family protein [Pseudomonadota bacterium]
MAFDQQHYEAMAGALGAMEGLSEKKMFGGLCFMLHGNMLCGVHKGGGMFRVGKDNEAVALELPGVAPLSFTGRKMGGMVDVEAPVFEDAATMSRLIELATGFVSTLPAK